MLLQGALHRSAITRQCRQHCPQGKRQQWVGYQRGLVGGRGLVFCRGQETKQTGTDSSEQVSSEEFESGLSDEQLTKIAELQKQREGGESEETSWWQGAMEEAKLVDWPPPGKAVVQTVLVIGIVASTSVMLFALNTVLTDVSRWIYSL